MIVFEKKSLHRQCVFFMIKVSMSRRMLNLRRFFFIMKDCILIKMPHQILVKDCISIRILNVKDLLLYKKRLYLKEKIKHRKGVQECLM